MVPPARGRARLEGQALAYRGDRMGAGSRGCTRSPPTRRTSRRAAGSSGSPAVLLAALSSRSAGRRDGHVATAAPGCRRLVGRIARRVPWVFNIQDVFPDVAVELGAITNPKVISVASWLERFLYRCADAVTVLSEDLRDNVARKLAGHGPDRVHVIPNFVDTERIVPGDRMTATAGSSDSVMRPW
ncbi:MAG: glycosyltransferase [Microthrixaceae bacterium]|nr:glycosyltransferase [Microthrixaceae bacterium]